MWVGLFTLAAFIVLGVLAVTGFGVHDSRDTGFSLWAPFGVGRHEHENLVVAQPRRR
jgi:hypothetical protein